jgi:hypothetical protein
MPPPPLQIKMLPHIDWKFCGNYCRLAAEQATTQNCMHASVSIFGSASLSRMQRAAEKQRGRPRALIYERRRSDNA